MFVSECQDPHAKLLLQSMNVRPCWELRPSRSSREGLLVAELTRTQLGQEVASSQPRTASYQMDPDLHEIVI